MQRGPTGQGYEGGGHTPMHGGSGAAYNDKPADTVALQLVAMAWHEGRTGTMGHESQQHSSWPRISICVDDFGLHEGINKAVFALARQGRVQAVSAMVGGPAWKDGALALRVFDQQQLEVGLHLDLTEFPQQPALLTPIKRLIVRAYLRRLDEAVLRSEIRAQFDAFEQAMGRAPAFVDGHQHVHQLPMVRTLLLQELARRYPAGNLWLRATFSPQGAAHSDAVTGFKSHGIALLGARSLSKLARRQGLRQNVRLLGVYDFTGGVQQYRARLTRWLRAAKDGDLLMCHVGLPSHMPDVLADTRKDEFAVLAAPDFETLLLDARVRLKPMGQILCWQ